MKPESTSGLPAPLRTIEREGAAKKIIEDLRSRILSGELPRGSKLPTEKEFASAYGVSSATVREAFRALATIHMVEVRHGSGSYVTADTAELVAQSLDSIVRFERIKASDILGVLAVLNAHAAEHAAMNASAAQLAKMKSALEALKAPTDFGALELALTAFLDGLAEASGNPLLISICRFLTQMQVQRLRDLTGGSLKSWQRTAERIGKERRKIFDAIVKRDPKAAHIATLNYHKATAAEFGNREPH